MENGSRFLFGFGCTHGFLDCELLLVTMEDFCLSGFFDLAFVLYLCLKELLVG